MGGMKVALIGLLFPAQRLSLKPPLERPQTVPEPLPGKLALDL